MKPLVLYSIGKEVCTAKANMADRHNIPVASDVSCFLEGLENVEALAVNVYQEMLYMSDTATKAIYRMRLDVKDHTPEIIVANTGIVRGKCKYRWKTNSMFLWDEVV